MYVIKRYLVRFTGAGGGEKGELKIKDGPTMLMKTKEEGRDNLTNATMFMKTSDLSRYTHDIHENKGSCAPV